MEENRPPPAKLKQAKLSFFKSSPVSVAGSGCGQGKKRRSSGSNCLDSPTKSLKSGKPLNIIALDNTDCQNGKAPKIRKISSAKMSSENDYEVTSSSEADAGSGKGSNGNFMERFVRKLPQDVQQEISSTNEMFELIHQIPTNELKPVCEDQKIEEKLQPEESVTSEPVCIIIDDDDDENKISEDKMKPVIDRITVPGSVIKTDSILSETVTKREHETVSLNKEDIPEEGSIQDVSNSAVVIENNSGNKHINLEMEEALDSSFLSNHYNMIKDDTATDGSVLPSLDDTATDGSFLQTHNDSATDGEDLSVLDISATDISVLPSECSTPKRMTQETQNTSKNNCGNKKRKVESSKKAEKEAQKLQRENDRQERKRKLEEEKAEKERIKKEKKEIKDKQRQELKIKLEKEKQEKEKAKEEDRKKKEEEKQKKEEDKKKKQAAFEAKQEEKRKKEEERKHKEEEKLKEEEEKRKKEEKSKQVFENYFIKPKEVNVKPITAKQNTGKFIPFQLKKDMHLAPTVRRDALTEEKKKCLDQILAGSQNGLRTYLEELKLGDLSPQKTGRILRKNSQPEEDVKVIHDSEALKKVTHHAKLLQFHTDYRPPYYGTWRRRSAVCPRNPWKKDELVFDYEVDSDEEWEEEEPGESLSCSDGEEEKGDDVDDEDDDGWMVPHGYLSEDEGCNEDDEITPEKLKLQQLAKAKAWEEDQKKKLQAAPAIIVGSFFEHGPSVSMTGDVRLLYDFRIVVLAGCTPIQTSLYGCPEPEKLEETFSEGAVSTPSQKGFQKKTVPDEAMPDLIRLVHGNTCGIKRLIREFRMYWLKRNGNPTATPDGELPVNIGGLDDSFVDRDTDVSSLNNSLNESCDHEQISSEIKDDKGGAHEDGNECSISKRQLMLKISSMAVREKRPGFNKICWYVHENILIQFNMSDIQLPNTWVHILPVHARLPAICSKVEESPSTNASKNVKSPFPRKKETKSPAPRKSKLAELQVPGGSKLSGKPVDEFLNESSAMLTDGVTESQEDSKKKIIKDQRSIKDFALSKVDLAKRSENLTSEGPLITVQDSPKEVKKISNQKSITDFANKLSSSRNSYSNRPDVQSLNCTEIVDSNISYDGKPSAECASESTYLNIIAGAKPMEVDVKSTDGSQAENTAS